MDERSRRVPMNTQSECRFQGTPTCGHVVLVIDEGGVVGVAGAGGYLRF